MFFNVTTKEEIDFLSQHKGNITFEITPQHLTILLVDEIAHSVLLQIGWV